MPLFAESVGALLCWRAVRPLLYVQRPRVLEARHDDIGVMIFLFDRLSKTNVQHLKMQRVCTSENSYMRNINKHRDQDSPSRSSVVHRRDQSAMGK
jgi:hypothetical protein